MQVKQYIKQNVVFNSGMTDVELAHVIGGKKRKHPFNTVESRGFVIKWIKKYMF